MDAYSLHGDHYYQGYPPQAPPPGTAPNQAMPLGTLPSQPPAPASTPLAPPGVAPSPSSTAASYYGTYAPPPYGYLPSSAERWSSYPIPAPETHPYSSYPPTLHYDRPDHGHHPYHQQDPFLYTHSFPGPPQAYVPLPPRGSDVTRFRKKRPFLPQQNLRPKNKHFKQPHENFRGGGKNSEQVKRAFNSDPRAFNVAFNGIPMANNAQILHPLWQGRADEGSANRSGKKRRMDERGEARPGRNDDRRKGDKRPRPGWNKGKRKKGRKQGGDKISMDPNGNAKRTSPTVRGFEAVPMTGEQAQEAAIWLELHRDVRKRVLEFLHASERESFQKIGMQDTQDATVKAVFGDANAAMQQDTQEPTLKAVGEDANAEMQDTQEGRQEAVGGIANAQMQDTRVEVGGDVDAEMQNSQEAADETRGTQEAIEEAVCAHANAQMPENDAAAQLDCVDTQQATKADSSQADHMNALHSNCTEEHQLDHMCAAQSDSADLLLPNAHIDVVQSEAPHPDEVNIKKLNIVDILKSDCENAPRLATEIVQNFEVEGVREFPGVDEGKCEHNNQNPLLETAHIFDKKHGKHPEALMQEELKEREEKTFDFFTKLLEENKELRNMYIEKCNNGSFECLMCHSKMKKRFSNLVSLVTHASNVLKTKKLPEHRGYGRAVCSLFGWDPHRIPKVPKSQVSHSGVENVPGDDERAPVGDGDVGNAVEHAHVADAIAHEADAVKGAPAGIVAESKLRGDVDESALRGEADDSVHTANSVEGEPVGDGDQTKLRGEIDESAPLGDADKCAPLRESDSSVEQELIEDSEDIVDKGRIIKEPRKDWYEQAMVAEDVEREEGGKEQVEEVDITNVAKSLEAGAEALEYEYSMA